MLLATRTSYRPVSTTSCVSDNCCTAQPATATYYRLKLHPWSCWLQSWAQLLLVGRIRLMGLTLTHFLVLGAILFSIGLYGALSKHNAVAVLMGIEIMLNAVNITLVAFSAYNAVPKYTGLLT